MKIKIELLSDKYTGKFSLAFVKGNGGKRISKGKDTGSWNVVETFDCEFDKEDLKEYGISIPK